MFLAASAALGAIYLSWGVEWAQLRDGFRRTMWITGVSQGEAVAPSARVLSHDMRNEESGSRDRFDVMIVLLFILSAALMAVLMLFSAKSLDGPV